jgi:glyceraldehyde 3-phosphate dehydrogenase
MATRIAINGFGRIGRCVFRALNHSEFDVVAVNDLTDAQTLAHLLKYDSVHGTFPEDVTAEDDAITAGNVRFAVLAERDPSKLPWKDLGVEIVVESTGRFRTREAAGQHIEAGADRVVISAPGREVDGTFCVGVNHQDFDADKHFVVSNASCTTNCLAPVAKVLNDNFGIECGLMTTIHSVTNDQRILDLPHRDLRRARAAYESMIPTTTGAARAVTLVLPELADKLDGYAVRVPTKDVSLVDLTVQVNKAVTAKDVNDVFRAAATEGPLAGVLSVSDEPLVSIDYMGNPSSSTVDLGLTDVSGDRLVRVVSWYDNEWGYSNRVVDLVRHIARSIH